MQITNVTVNPSHSKSNASRIYIWPNGETIIQNLINRRQRPYTQYRREVLPKLFSQLGWSPDTRVRWSSYAGCSCPCSPGFIVTDGPRRLSVSVTISD